MVASGARWIDGILWRNVLGCATEDCTDGQSSKEAPHHRRRGGVFSQAEPMYKAILPSSRAQGPGCKNKVLNTAEPNNLREGLQMKVAVVVTRRKSERDFSADEGLSW